MYALTQARVGDYVISAPVGMTEYVVRLANHRATHCIQIEDGWDHMKPDDDQYDKAHELVLGERPGRTHQSYVRGRDFIK